MFKLTPTNSRFYDHFDRASDITLQAAEYFHAFLSAFEPPGEHYEEVKRLEHQVDEVVHQTMGLLHRSFITPIDRGDIRLLIEALDTVIDLINVASNRIAVYWIAYAMHPRTVLTGGFIVNRLIEFPLGSSSSVLVEVVAPEGAAPAARPEAVSQSFEATFDRIKPIASTVVSRLRSLSDPPDELRVELGLKMSPAGLVVSAGGAEANFKVTLMWKR